jgi:hypothetical protein
MPTHSTRPLRFGLPADDVIIIHHLSDLEYRQLGKDIHPIFAYAAYLNTLEPEQFPDVVIITGNLTATGKQEDFQGLAGIIQGMFSRFGTRINQHVFVVPGMLDLNWEKQPPEYSAFAQAFASFGTPTTTSVIDVPSAKYLVFPIDTCYVPEKLAPSLLHTLQERIDQYQRLYKQQSQRRTLFSSPPFKKPPKPDASLLRQQYAEASNNLLFALDAGMVKSTDVATLRLRLQKWAATEFTVDAAASIMHPLKILVTHHPLMPLAENNIWPQAHMKAVADLLQIAHEHDFQLALHGYAQISQIEANVLGEHIPLRQLGAGWLRTREYERSGSTHLPVEPATPNAGKEKIFNEIIARYSHKDGRWLLEMRCKLLANPQSSPPSYNLLNRADDSAGPPAEDSREKKLLAMREKVEKQLRLAMAQFSDNITTAHVQDILSRPLTTVRDAIGTIIFGDCVTRIGLAIKTAHHVNNLITLKYAYIEPTVDNHQQFIHPFRYPLTFASWALILGRPLLFPKNYADEDTLDNDDTQWITHSNKSDAINRALSTEINFAEAELLRHAGTSFAPEQSDLTLRRDRAQKIMDIFNHNSLTLKEIYQEPYNDIQSSPFKEFIAVPIPLRPDGDAMPTLRPEIGVLLIDAYRLPSKEGEKPVQEAIFFEERVEMLRLVSDLLFLMLTTADKLNRPTGIWHSQANA